MENHRNIISKKIWTMKADLGILLPWLLKVDLKGKNILHFIC